MYATSKPRRIALAAIAVGSLTFLAACGGDASSGGNPAADDTAGSGDSGDQDHRVLPHRPGHPGDEGSLGGRHPLRRVQGLQGRRPGPQHGPAEAGHGPDQRVVESGAVAGAWAIMIAPPAAAPLVQTALDKDVPLILNGTPADYGLDGLEPGVSFSTIDYAAQGKAMGEELGNCINEKLDGKAQVLYGESAPGTAGKEEHEKPSRRPWPPPLPTPRSSRPSPSPTAPRRRPTWAPRSRATPTSPP